MSLIANCSSGHVLINSRLSRLSYTSFEDYAASLPALGTVRRAVKGGATLPLLA